MRSTSALKNSAPMAVVTRFSRALFIAKKLLCFRGALRLDSTKPAKFPLFSTGFAQVKYTCFCRAFYKFTLALPYQFQTPAITYTWQFNGLAHEIIYIWARVTRNATSNCNWCMSISTHKHFAVCASTLKSSYAIFLSTRTAFYWRILRRQPSKLVTAVTLINNAFTLGLCYLDIAHFQFLNHGYETSFNMRGYTFCNGIEK
jgi:hypothetical protein